MPTPFTIVVFSQTHILLNSTMLRGKGTMTTNQNVDWKEVPAHLTICKGNVLKSTVNPI
ncbi:MAG: hypothetical protein AB7U98_08245 [Candidatus Nitrosocosmicus sp.]